MMASGNVAQLSRSIEMVVLGRNLQHAIRLNAAAAAQYFNADEKLLFKDSWSDIGTCTVHYIQV